MEIERREAGVRRRAAHHRLAERETASVHQARPPDNPVEVPSPLIHMSSGGLWSRCKIPYLSRV
jgi:hypothetical protein